eukprot:TRINITY_DN7443_c0_g1_i1.p1 TRINITY_DN7443_c0_g1~~TRINITY_DN7443_c0_g1_i1.p1  ORF type:complete len:271 (+),score=83.68 TRINITY_DN7443_c0_g1_i1:77-814(+)
MAELTERIVLQKTKVDSLANVKNLNLWGSELEDVSILAKMPNVEVLSLSVNRIQRLGDFAGCKSLMELYLRKNEIKDLSEVQRLRELPKLKILWLCDNPCASHPFYRPYVIKTLPGLEKLDNIDVTEQERQAAQSVSDAEVAAAAGRPARAHAAGSAPSSGRPRAGSGGQRGGASDAVPAPDHPPAPGARAAPRRSDAAGGGGGRADSATATQRNLIIAIQALLNELTPASLHQIEDDIRQRLSR